MIKVKEALELLYNIEISFNEVERTSEFCLDFVLAENIYSKTDLPPFRQSAMDGYALCGHQKKYVVVDEVKAGDTRKIALENGQAVRIFTGAPIPDNAIAVIMQEKVEVDDNLVIINDEILEGKNIRPIGEQLKFGDLVLEKGHSITPATIGLLHSIGLGKVKVFDKPKIWLLITGDELKKASETLHFGEIYESNSVTISTALQQTGFSANPPVFIKDDFNATKVAVKKALDESDVVILSGGISVGEYDFVKKALEENGVQEIFYKINQKPGKPIFFGKKGQKFIFALPGNPAAALTCYYIYIVPFLRKLSGCGFSMLDVVKAELKSDFNKKGEQAQFLKGVIYNGKVEVLDGQASSMLWSFAKANCLIFLPDNQNEFKENQEVECYLLPKL